MKTLNKIAAPVMLAALALGAVSPAMAQPRHPQSHQQQRGGYNANQIRAQIAELQRRIDRNDFRGRISERETRALRNDVRNLQNTFRAYNRNGLDRREVATLNNRIDNIRGRLRIESRDWNNRRW